MRETAGAGARLAEGEYLRMLIDDNQAGPSILILIRRLIEEEIGCQLLVLVTREIGLDDQVPLEPQSTQL